MRCVIFDSNKKLMGQFSYFTNAHVNTFCVNNPSAEHFLFLDGDESIVLEGELRLSNSNQLLVGYLDQVDHPVETIRVFNWEKYSDPANVPEGLESEVNANLMHLYNGGTEQTVPYPFDDVEIESNIYEDYVVGETIIPIGYANKYSL